MSTTRKIEGWVESGGQHLKHTIHHAVKMPNDKAATLLIHDGEPHPVYTQEEHEAEFQRRAKAMVKDMLGEVMHSYVTDSTMRSLEVQSVQTGRIISIAARYGITLP